MTLSKKLIYPLSVGIAFITGGLVGSQCTKTEHESKEDKIYLEVVDPLLYRMIKQNQWLYELMSSGKTKDATRVTLQNISEGLSYAQKVEERLDGKSEGPILNEASRGQDLRKRLDEIIIDGITFVKERSN